MGGEGKGRLPLEPPFVHCCGRWRPQIPDWLSRDDRVTYWRVSWRVLVRDKHHEGIKEMCPTDRSYGRSKLYIPIM